MHSSAKDCVSSSRRRKTCAWSAEQPDIVLVDIDMPGGDVTTTVSQIRSRSPGSRVTVLSMHEGPHLVQTLAAGIRG